MNFGALPILASLQEGASDAAPTALGDFCETRGGYAFPPALQGRTSGAVPFFKVSDMNLEGNGVKLSIANHWVSDEDVTHLRAHPFPAGTVVFPKVGAAIATNKKRLLTRPSLIDNNVMGVTPDPTVCLPEFLLYWFLLFDLSSISAVGPLPSITATAVKALTIRVPPIAEQRRIARILSTIQQSVKATSSMLSSLSALRRTLISSTLSDLSAAGIAMRLEGLIERPQYGFTASASSCAGPRFLRITDITEEGVDWARVPSCEPAPSDGPRYALTDGDLVVARIGATTGKAFLVRQPPNAVFASYLIRVRARSGVDPRFIAAFFDSPGYWAQVDASKGGRLKGGVNIDNLNCLQVPLFSEAEQHRLGDQLDAIDASLAATRRKRDALGQLFRVGLKWLLGCDQ